MTDNRIISQRLRDAGYTHRKISGHGLYRHEIARTDTGDIVGYMDAAEACRFLHVPRDEELLLAPRIVGYGMEERP